MATGVTLPLGARRVPGWAAQQEEVPSLEPPSCSLEPKYFPGGVRLKVSLAMLPVTASLSWVQGSVCSTAELNRHPL